MNIIMNNEFKAFEKGEISDPRELFYFTKAVNIVFDPFISRHFYFNFRHLNAFIQIQREELLTRKDIHNKVYEFYKKIYINKEKIDLSKYHRKNKRYSI